MQFVGAEPSEKMKFQLSLRRRGLSDLALLRAMESVPRDKFVAEIYRSQAWQDTALAIECGQTISQPFLVGYVTEKLQIKSHHRILEVGTGSGYHTAILAKLGREVVSVERFRTLADQARHRMADLGLTNVEVILGDGFALPADMLPFDRILVSASVELLPESLLSLLAVDGELIAPVGPATSIQKLVRIKNGPDGRVQTDLMDARFVPAISGIARVL